MSIGNTAGAIRRHTPDGGVSQMGFINLVLGLLVVGGVLGFVVHLVSKAFYFIILFPVLIGLAVGFVGAWMCKRGHIRNPLLAGVVGLLAGLLAMTMVQYFGYRELKQTVQAELHDDWKTLYAQPPQEREQTIAEMDREDQETARSVIEVLDGTSSLAGYMHLQATHGVSIAGRSNSSGINLGYTGSWIYWLVEVGIVAGIAFAIMRGQARQPYCVQGAAWKEPVALSQFNVAGADVQSHLEAANIPALVAARADGGATILKGFPGSTPTEDAELRVETWVVANNSGSWKELATYTAPGSFYQQLQTALSQPLPEAAPDQAGV